MFIDCVADLNGYYPVLEGGDLLIVAGDLTASDEHMQYMKFCDWIERQNYIKKVVIAGNHDNLMVSTIERHMPHVYCGPHSDYLCDSGTEFEGLKIWGSPWSLTFLGINPHCTAFTGTEEELEAKFKLIPNDTDILITHGPPYGILDTIRKYGPFSHEREESIGSESLLRELGRIRPKLHVFGHIYEEYGQFIPNLEPFNLPGYPIFVNCSHVNEHYKPVNKPIRIIL